MKKTAPPPQTAPRKNSAEHAVPRGSARRRVAENGGAIFKIVPLIRPLKKYQDAAQKFAIEKESRTSEKA